jgi:polyisoprenyl-phosphate glycosyltransferase
MIQTFVSFVVYIGHEDNSIISHFFKTLTHYANQTFSYYEIIVVNDSTDERTQSLLETEASNLNSHFIILDLSYRHGLEHGMIAGLERAMGDYVFEIDSVQWNYSDDLLEDMFKQAISGFDIVFARAKQENPIITFSYLAVDRLFHFPKNLPAGLVKIISRRAINNIMSFIHDKKINKFIFRNSLYALTGYPINTISCEPIKGKKIPKFLRKEGIINALSFKLLFLKLKFKYILFALCLFFLPSLYFPAAYNSDLKGQLPSIVWFLFSINILAVIFVLFISIVYVYLLLRNQYQTIYQIKKIKIYKSKDQLFNIKQ